MSQPSVIWGLQMWISEPEGHPEGRQRLWSNSCRLDCCHSWQGTKNVKKKKKIKKHGAGPQRAEMHIKEIILVNLEACIFPYIEEC